MKPNFTKENKLYEGRNTTSLLVQDQACAEWKKLLESTNGFPQIRNKNTRRATAMMLRNQLVQLRTEGYKVGPQSQLNEAMNTSLLGPANGLTGGALHAVDTYATGDYRLPKILIPMIRRIFPSLIANEIVGVQPMPGPVALGYAIRFVYDKGPNFPADSTTHHIHGHSGVAENGGYDSHGIRGIETKYSYDNKNHTLILVKGQGFPKPQPVAFVVPAADNKFDAVASPFVEQIAGVVDLSSAKNQETADEALQAAYTAIDKLFVNEKATGYVTGMSQWDAPDGALNAKNNELGFQRLDTRFSGSRDARLMEKLAGGRWRFPIEDTGVAARVQNYENTGAVGRTKFEFRKQAVEAGTRKMASTWSLELEEDLKNTNGIDIANESVTSLSYELQAEIDRELLVRMIWVALKNGEYSLFDGRLADARWFAERNAALVQNINKVSGRMAVRNRRGRANFIVCTPDINAIFSSLETFVPFTIKSDVEHGNTMAAKSGTLNNMYTVYVDWRTPVYDFHGYGEGYEDMFDTSEIANQEGIKLPNYVLLGYKGPEVYDSGIIYCPYIPIIMQRANDPVTFSPNIGLMTRYGVLDNIFGANLYYHMILIDSLSQPGIPSELQSQYPAGHISPSLADKPASFAFPVSVAGEVTTKQGE